MSHLSSRQINLVKEVMNRLSQVPVVPPMESLRYISLVLVCPDRNLQAIIGECRLQHFFNHISHLIIFLQNLFSRKNSLLKQVNYYNGNKNIQISAY